ncbi:MAG: exosome complex RNA-binding protein Csl4 [Aigarchaeota archaeon]|nr:exosome complex RNA-binding protein Csl4 [Candidatus Pelearchaeum maunauluense]
MKREEVVVPGEPLCIIEEFFPGKGTKASNDGSIYSIYVGKPSFDFKKREVLVSPFKKVENVRKGEHVVAEVKDLQDKIAVVQIIAKPNSGPLKYRRTAVVVSKKGEPLDNAIGIGDIIIALVSNILNGMYTLDIYAPSCGVILAMCSYCRATLLLKGNSLVCSRCGRKESRRITHDYGNINKLFQIMGWGV